MLTTFEVWGHMTHEPVVHDGGRATSFSVHETFHNEDDARTFYNDVRERYPNVDWRLMKREESVDIEYLE